MTQQTDFRVLCAELTDELSGYASANPHHDSDALVIRARAALAEPVAAFTRPTDEELDDLWDQEAEYFALYGEARLFACAVLARWGNHSADASKMVGQPAPPAEGEVAELVAWLRDRAESVSIAQNALRITRAADLLEQRHPAPVPVAERLPGPEDCDAEGRCWFWRTDGVDEFWEFVVPLSNIHEFNLTAQWRYAHWLPAHALPLPSGEVQP